VGVVLLGNNKGMPRIDGTDIKKCDHLVIFVNDAGFRLPVDNPTESAFQNHRFGHCIHNHDSVESQHERRAGRLADRQAAATICPVLVSPPQWMRPSSSPRTTVYRWSTP